MLLSLTLLLSMSVHAADDDATARVSAALAKVLPPGLKPDRIVESSMPGLFEVMVHSRLLYVSADGRHVFVGSGDLIDLDTMENLSDKRRRELTLAAVDSVDEKDMIVIGPKDAKRTITVFTDVDCPYCAKFHLEVPKLVENGVKVRYLLYPRSGLNGRTYQRSVAVWCAEDRVKAIGVAKAGGKLEMKTCPNPVAEHYAAGQKAGVTGTPTIVLDNGDIVGGYRPADQMLAILGLKPAKVSAK
jgi:thiol:disulfide interchange protein DsbC